MYNFDQHGVDVDMHFKVEGSRIESGDHVVLEGVHYDRIKELAGNDEDLQLWAEDDSSKCEPSSHDCKWAGQFSPDAPNLVFENAGSPLQVTQVHKYDGNPQVVLIGLNTPGQLAMPNYRGGDNPGVWLDKGPVSGKDGGMWSSPIILSLIIWYVARVMILFNELLLDKARSLDPSYATETAIMRFSDNYHKSYKIKVWFISSWSMGYFIAPLQSMTTHDICPHIILSFYSGRLQMFYAFGFLGMNVLVVCGGVCFGCVVGDAWRASRSISSLLFAQLAGFSFTCIFCGIIYAVKRFYVSLIFGITINFEWTFADFDLALKINIFHLFTWLLWVAAGWGLVTTFLTGDETSDKKSSG